jgi:hypothetical protein
MVMLNSESINKSCNDFSRFTLYDPGLFLFEVRADIPILVNCIFLSAATVPDYIKNPSLITAILAI